MGRIFIDLDHVIDKVTDRITPEALEIVEKVNSYTEYSQSKTGLHIYAKGQKHTTACRKGFLEVYSHSRFSCITNSPYGKIRPLSEATDAVAVVEISPSDLERIKRLPGECEISSNGKDV